MIIGAQFLKELELSRIVCVPGSVSSGKTRLIVDLYASHFYTKGYRYIANIPHNFPRHPWENLPERDKPTKQITDTAAFALFQTQYAGLFTPETLLYKTFIHLDEAGEVARTSKLSSLVTRSAGKANSIVAISGKKLPHKDLQEIVCVAVYDFDVNLGLPFILWNAKVNPGPGVKPYSFLFWQVFPRLVHGIYSTMGSGGSIDSIVNAAALTVARLAYDEGQTSVIGQYQGSINENLNEYVS